MRKVDLLITAISFFIVILSINNTFASGKLNRDAVPGVYNKILLPGSSKDKQVLFGIDEIVKASNQRGLTTLHKKRTNTASSELQ